MLFLPRVLVAISGLLFLATAAGDPVPAGQQLWIPSRGIEIPITLQLPADNNRPWPLVVMAHGHGGSRDEAGGFAELANLLAMRGIASVRMDFPACGESREPWPQNTIEHMLADLAAARDYALAQATLDGSRVGLLGYSMGGRLAMLSAGSGFPYAALVLWAPAASAGNADFLGFFGGPQRYSEYRNQALEQGTAPITTPWGQTQQLSAAWFTGLENSTPLQALSGFDQPVLVLHGAADEVIPPAHSEPIATQLPQSQRALIASGTHGLGFYDQDPTTAAMVLSGTQEFFVSTLFSR